MNCSLITVRARAGTTNMASAIRGCRRIRRSREPLPMLGAFLEDSLGPDQEHEDQQDERDGIPPRTAQKERGEAFHNTVREPSDDGPADASEASEDDDREGLDGGGCAGIRAEGVDDAEEGAGQSGKPRADPEAGR